MSHFGAFFHCCPRLDPSACSLIPGQAPLLVRSGCSFVTGQVPLLVQSGQSFSQSMPGQVPQLAQSSHSFSPGQVALPLRREGGHTNSGCVARLPSAARSLCRSSAGCSLGPGHVALGEQVATQTPAVSLACPAQPGRSFIPVLVAPLAQGMWLLGPLAGRLICHPGQAALSSQGRLLCCPIDCVLTPGNHRKQPRKDLWEAL